MSANPMKPAATWQRKPGIRATRIEDKLAKELDRLMALEVKMRRSFRAWERQCQVVDRLNKRFNKVLGEALS